MEKFINTKNVKKYILISILMLISIIVYGQVAVYDSKSNSIQAQTKAQIIKQVNEALKQTEKLQHMVETAQKNLEFLEKINTEVKNINRIKEIAMIQKDLINEAFALKKQYNNTPILEVKLQVEKATNTLLEGTKTNLQELTRILSDGTYKMNDADRLREIRVQQEDMALKYQKLQYLKTFIKNYESTMKIYSMNLPK